MKKNTAIASSALLIAALLSAPTQASSWGAHNTHGHLFAFGTSPVSVGCTSGIQNGLADQTDKSNGSTSCNSGYNLTTTVTNPHRAQVPGNSYGNSNSGGHGHVYNPYHNRQPMVGFGGFFSSW